MGEKNEFVDWEMVILFETGATAGSAAFCGAAAARRIAELFGRPSTGVVRDDKFFDPGREPLSTEAGIFGGGI